MANNVIEVGADGPFHGTCAVAEAAPGEVWLCRCGQSKNKPHCDGAHRAAGFTDPATYAVGALGEATGDLVVKPVPNGPLLCSGGVEVRDATGTVVFRGEKAALCRCGRSSNKPFCDATHRKLGFQAP